MTVDPASDGGEVHVLAEYLAGRMPLADAVAHFVSLASATGSAGIGVDLESLDDDARPRAEELFRRVVWCKFTGADPGMEPPLAFGDLLAAMRKPESA